MCGRYTLRTNLHDVAEAFDVPVQLELPLRYNIAPTQDVAAVRFDAEQGQRELGLLSWGLIPSWAKDKKIASKLINARGETVAEKPSFRSAFTKRRCLIVADGFYEWQKLAGGKKQPYYIHFKDDAPFAFAGLWESWNGEGEAVESCTIITTSANDVMQPLHDRMPVILSAADYDSWLDPTFKDKAALKELLKPCPADWLETYPVSTRVNNPKHDEPACLERID
jgi:putative SOS response-associated peptidase YedK